MKKFGEIFLSDEDNCSYLSDRKSRFENFLALDLSYDEIDLVLSRGWRKFGPHFFRPKCPSCQACRPLRVLTKEFTPSKSQRRVLKKSAAVKSKFIEINYRPAYFELYQKHSQAQFENIPISSEREFVESFLIPSAPALIHELVVGDQLVALGFCDVGTNSLSSVYFCYDPEYSDLSLGTLGALYEIEWAKSQGLQHYYLGYYIKENRHMSYKARFSPHEIYDWYNESWTLPTKDK